MKSSIILVLFISNNLCGIINLDSLKTCIANNNKVDTNKINTLNLLANSYLMSKNDSALLFANQALNEAKKIKYLKGMAAAYKNLGDFYNGASNFDLSIYNLIESYKIYEQLDSKAKMSNALNSIANSYLGLNNYIKAQEYYLKSYNIAVADSNKAMIATTSVGLGNILLNNNKPKEAFEYFNKSVILFNSIPNALTQKALTLLALGNSLIQLHENKKAYKSFEESVELLSKIKNRYGLASAYSTIGKAYYDENEIKKSLFYYLKADSIFKIENSYLDMKDISFAISELYKKDKQFEKSLNYYVLFSKYKDSIFNGKKSKQLLEVEAKYETEKKENQNKLLRLENALSTDIIKQQKIIFYIIAATLLIMSILAFFILKGLKKQQKANEVISRQKQEVELQKHKIEIHQKEIIDSIKYAKRIQQASLPHSSYIKKYLNG